MPALRQKLLGKKEVASRFQHAEPCSGVSFSEDLLLLSAVFNVVLLNVLLLLRLKGTAYNYFKMEYKIRCKKLPNSKVYHGHSPGEKVFKYKTHTLLKLYKDSNDN